MRFGVIHALLLIIIALLLFIIVDDGRAATARQPRAHIYQTGKIVKGLQWMLKGHKPSHYRFYVTYHGKVNGKYNTTTARAVKNMKYRLGYPKRILNGKKAGPYFFSVLKGRTARPVEWKGVAWQRTKGIKAADALRKAKASTCTDEILAAARSVRQGYKETWSANWGPEVVNYQHITHNSYHAAWCVSFTQWVNVHAGIGPIADASAGVNYVYNWANQRGMVHSQPRPGAWVAYGYSHNIHMGIVESVNRDGSYTTIEGNHNNGVYRVHRSPHENYPVFLWQPCLLPRT